MSGTHFLVMASLATHRHVAGGDRCITCPAQGPYPTLAMWHQHALLPPHGAAPPPPPPMPPRAIEEVTQTQTIRNQVCTSPRTTKFSEQRAGGAGVCRAT